MGHDDAPLSARWAGGPLGFMLRTWRRRRSMAQAELASRVGVSTKHLSFLERGHARPSREMVEWIAQALELSEDEQVRLAEAAGFTGGYLDLGAAGREVHDELRATLDGFPAPAMAHDRYGTLHGYNRALADLVAPYFDVAALEGVSSGHALLLGLGPHVENLPEIAAFYVRRLEAEILRGMLTKPWKPKRQP